MRATFAILGSMTIQGPVTQWVTDHRKHHALSDQEGDPHSPHAGFAPNAWGALKGFFHAHMGWLFHLKGMERGDHYGKDLYDDRLIRGIDRMYFVWVALTLRDCRSRSGTRSAARAGSSGSRCSSGAA